MTNKNCVRTCQNSTEKKRCIQCDVGCTSKDCDFSFCELFGNNGDKHHVCMCAFPTCKCMNRYPTKIEETKHIIEVYIKEIEGIKI